MGELIEDGPCRKSCNILEFIGKTVVEGEDVPEMNLNHATLFSYSIKAPATMVVNEEYLIYDLDRRSCWFCWRYFRDVHWILIHQCHYRGFELLKTTFGKKEVKTDLVFLKV